MNQVTGKALMKITYTLLYWWDQTETFAARDQYQRLWHYINHSTERQFLPLKADADIKQSRSEREQEQLYKYFRVIPTISWF